jgi:hypothetical protein
MKFETLLMALWLMAAAGCDRAAPLPAPVPAPAAAPRVESSAPAEDFEHELEAEGARVTEKGLMVELDDANFEPGTNDFKPIDPTRIDRIAALLRARQELHLVVFAKPASHERAESVRSLLIGRDAPDASRVVVASDAGPELGGHVTLRIVNDAGTLSW